VPLLLPWLDVALLAAAAAADVWVVITFLESAIFVLDGVITSESFVLDGVITSESFVLLLLF
jgi:hypothetical protein